MSKKSKKIATEILDDQKGGAGGVNQGNRSSRGDGNWNGSGRDRNSNPSSPIGNPGYRPDKDPTLTGTRIGPSYSDRARSSGNGGGGSGANRGKAGTGQTSCD